MSDEVIYTQVVNCEIGFPDAGVISCKHKSNRRVATTLKQCYFFFVMFNALFNRVYGPNEYKFFSNLQLK